MAKQFFNVRRKTGLLLVILVLVLGILSILSSFDVFDFMPAIGLVISLMFVVIVSVEFSVMSVLRKRFGLFEWAALAVVVLALIPIVMQAFGAESILSERFSGIVTVVLIGLGIFAILTKQKGEK